MKIAVVTAVLNEVDAIERLLTALAAQTRVPDSLLIADGGSTDGTLEKIAALAPALPFAVQVLAIPGKIAKGRNAAIARTDAEIIAVTDADCVPVAQWLEALTVPIERETAAAVAGGYYADAGTPIERAIATFTWVPLTTGTTRFLPSHRSVAYLRTVWQSLGGYNEEIDSGEDTSFDLQVEKRFPYATAPAAQVAWRPRRTLKKAMWQQVFYGAGDGQAHIQLRYHAAIALFVAAEIALLFGNAAVKLAASVMLAGGTAYFILKHYRLFRRLAPDFAYITALMMTLPPARLFGFTVGLFGGSVRGILNRS